MNDFDEIHSGEQTKLKYHGHRQRFGEKALRYGGIDIVLRVLAEFPRDEDVGYHGILDIFKEAKQAPGLLIQLPKIRFFLQGYETHIAPRLRELAQMKSELAKRHKELRTPPSAQAIANELLNWIISNSFYSLGVVDAAIKACRRELGSQLVFHTEDAPRTTGCNKALGGTGRGWAEVFHHDTNYALVYFHSVLSAGGSFRPYARGDLDMARTLLSKLDWYEQLDDQCPTTDQILRLCVAKRAFDDAGLERICRVLHQAPPRLSEEQFDFRRDLDALRVALGARPKSQPHAPPTEPLHFAVQWLVDRVG